MRYLGPLLTKPVFDALLAARDAGETAWTGSLDLGRSQDLAALAADAWEWRGQRYPYPGKLKDRTIYWWDGEGFASVSRYAGSLIKLVPSEWNVPTFEIDGIKMLPTAKESPLDDARRKVALVQPAGKTILDTCGGLGYFAACCLDAGVARLQSFEKNEDVLWLRTLNPWSPDPDESDGRLQLAHAVHRAGHSIGREGMQDATQGFDFDMVIVGASFAGAACAIAAAQRGLRVCVLERKRDPGDKLRTTGIIVKEAAERTLLHRLPAPITRRIESVRLYAPSLKQVALAAPGYYFLTTDTPAAMRWLAGHLREHGVDLRLGCAFTDAQRIDGGWQVQGAGSTRYLVGADGARSRVAKRCGLGEVRQFLYGIEYEFPGARLADPDALHCFISKRYAPGYIGWLAQNPGGVQAGLALRHDPANARVPDIDGFLLRVGLAGGLPRHLKPGHTRAGLIPCSGPVAAMARDNAILTGDAAGIVSPVTAGGIHAAWDHGWAVGRAIASHLRDNGPQPEQAAIDAAPRFRAKRALRWAYDRLQFDWPFDLLLHSPPLRWAAEQVYFHKRRSESAQSPGLRVRQRS